MAVRPAQAAVWPRSGRRGPFHLRRHPIHLDVDLRAIESAPQQDALPVLDHLWMAAEVRGAVLGREAGTIDMLAKYVLGAAALPLPLGILPRAAHRGNVG